MCVENCFIFIDADGDSFKKKNLFTEVWIDFPSEQFLKGKKHLNNFKDYL